MSHYDELLKTLRAAAFEMGVAEMADRAEISDDTVRRMLGPEPPQFMRNLKRLEEIASEPRPPAP